MIQPRRIFFHIGAPKTGTSAIQMFLASNIGNLRAIGLDYLKREPPREGLPTTGNGASVFRYFKRAQAPPEKLEDLLDGYFGTENGAVVSSELLYFIPAAGWGEIIQACRARNITPSVIYYVRNVYPFYASTYNQFVKNHGSTESFEEFVERNCVFYCLERLTYNTLQIADGAPGANFAETAAATAPAERLFEWALGCDAAHRAHPFRPWRPQSVHRRDHR